MLTVTEVIGATVAVSSIAFTIGQIAIANIKSKSNGKYVRSEVCISEMNAIGRTLDDLKHQNADLKNDVRVQGEETRADIRMIMMKLNGGKT